MDSDTGREEADYQDPDDWGEPGPDDSGLADDEGSYDQHADDHDDDRHGGQYRDADYYWRRRFLVLAGGLAIVGVIAGGLSTLLGPAKPVGGKPAPRASLAVRDTLPAAALGSPAGSGSSSSASAAASPGTSPSPAPGASSGSAVSPRAVASPVVTCAPSAIVLSLLTGQAQYSPGQQPRFEVYAVSTAPGSCTLAFGPSFVQVIVVRHGQVLWDSADCTASAPAARPLRFMQGVPLVTVLSWNRKARTSGCAGTVPAGTWGRVDAVALADGKYSPVRSFTLSR